MSLYDKQQAQEETDKIIYQALHRQMVKEVKNSLAKDKALTMLMSDFELCVTVQTLEEVLEMQQAYLQELKQIMADRKKEATEGDSVAQK